MESALLIESASTTAGEWLQGKKEKYFGLCQLLQNGSKFSSKLDVKSFIFIGSSKISLSTHYLRNSGTALVVASKESIPQ